MTGDPRNRCLCITFWRDWRVSRDNTHFLRRNILLETKILAVKTKYPNWIHILSTLMWGSRLHEPHKRKYIRTNKNRGNAQWSALSSLGVVKGRGAKQGKPSKSLRCSRCLEGMGQFWHWKLWKQKTSIREGPTAKKSDNDQKKTEPKVYL